jgi:hypothetical protein
MEVTPRKFTGPKKIVATGAVVLGVLLGAAGISAATTGSATPHRQTPTTRDVPEANDRPDSPGATAANRAN